VTISVLAEGIAEYGRYLERQPEITRRAASRALNQTARGGLRTVRELMAQDIAFPRGYLQDPRRLAISQHATESNLQAAIAGRQRPTSLARFAIGGSPNAPRAGVTVRVKPGRGLHLDRAFLLRLRAGAGPVTDDAFNLGLAVRLRPGERIENKRVMAKRAGGSLYLLYGPSVDQVFREVAEDAAPILADKLSVEFLRQFILLNGR
jgi:hypothetical protein